MPPLVCPSSAILNAFDRGDLPEALLVSTAEHVGDCSRCKKVLERLSDESADDPLIRGLRHLGEEEEGGVIRTRTVPPALRPGSDYQTKSWLVADAGSSVNESGGGTRTAPPTPQSAPLSSVNPAEPTVPEVFGHYLLGAKLGEGGMGVVYKAVDTRLKRTVALKMIRPGRIGSGAAISRFVAEAEAVARLQHPNVVQIHELGEVEGQPYAALEYVSGGSLDQRIRNTLPNHRTTAALMIPISRGVQAAHDLNLVHRDLKPANILLHGPANSPLDACVPKVTDFGLVKFLDDDSSGQTRADAIMGTPSYMAPEQAEGNVSRVGKHSDVYALGAILYDLLSGRPPFKGTTVRDTLRQVVEQEPVPPRHLQTKLPRDLETICLKCLQKDPARRYASCAEVAEELARFLNGEPILGRPVGQIEKTWRWTKRKPAIASLSFFSILTAVALLFGGFWFTYELSSERRKSDKAESDKKLAEVRELAADELRRTSDYYAGITQARERIAQRETGWTWQAVAEIEKAALVKTPARNETDLRSALASCFVGTDLRPARTVAEGFWSRLVAYHPNGRWLILPEDRLGAVVFQNARVRIVDAATDETVRELEYPLGRIGKPLQGRLDHPQCLAISPDGRWLAVGVKSGRVHRWDLNSNNPEAFTFFPEASDETCEVNQLAFSPDGSALFVAMTLKVPDQSPGNGSITRWETSTWKQTARHWTFATEGNMTVHLSGTTIYCDGSRGFIDQLNAFTLEKTGEFPRMGDRLRALSPDGRVYVITAENRIVLREFGKSNPVLTIRPPYQELPFSDTATRFVFSPDGRILAAADESSRHVYLFDTLNGAQIAEWKAPDANHGGAFIAFDPSSRFLAVGGLNRTTILEIGGQREHQIVAAGPYPMPGAALSPNGRLLAGLMTTQRHIYNERQYVSALWSLDGIGSSRPFWTSPAIIADGDAGCVSFHPSSNQFVVVGEGKLKIFDQLHGNASHWTLPVERMESAVLGPDNRAWMIAGQEVIASRLPVSDKDLLRWKNPSARITGFGGMLSLAAGRTRVVVGGKDGYARLFPAVFPAAATELPLPREISLSSGIPLTAAAVSPDDFMAVFGNDGGAGFVVSLPEGVRQFTWNAHRDRMTAAVFLCPGLLATGSRDGTVRVWALEGTTARELWTMRHQLPVTSLSASSDGHKLSVTCLREHGVHLWNLAEMNERFARMGIAIDAPASWAVPRLPVPEPAPTLPDETSWPVNGLRLELFADTELQDRRVVRHDTLVWDNWIIEAPQPQVPWLFSARWSGFLRPPKAGKYVFRVDGWSGWRMRLDGKLVASDWVSVRTTRTPEFAMDLEDRPHALRIELHHEHDSPGSLKFLWSKPGEFEEQPVSSSFLFHNETAARMAKPPTDPKPGNEIYRLTVPEVQFYNQLALSRDGRWLAASAGNRVMVWEALSGKLIMTAPVVEPPEGIAFLDFNADGSRLLISAGDKSSFAIWEPPTCKQLHQSPIPMPETVAKFAPDGRTFVSVGRDLILRRWRSDDLAAMEMVQLDFKPWSFEWAPDGQEIWMSGADAKAARWNPLAGTLKYLPFKSPGRTAKLIGSGTGMFVEENNPDCNARSKVRLIDPETGIERWSASFAGAHQWTAVSADHKVAAVVVKDEYLEDGGPKHAQHVPVRIFSLETGHEISRLIGHQDKVVRVCLSPDGRIAYTCSKDGTVRAWSVPSR